MIESFWPSVPCELLDHDDSDHRTKLATAVFEWIERIYIPRRCHTPLGNLSPVEYEAVHTYVAIAA